MYRDQSHVITNFLFQKHRKMKPNLARLILPSGNEMKPKVFSVDCTGSNFTTGECFLFLSKNLRLAFICLYLLLLNCYSCFECSLSYSMLYN